MQFDVVSIFPAAFPGPLGVGIVGRILESGRVTLTAHDLRTWADPPHFQVDDIPYGGGAGMVFKPEPLFRAVEAIRLGCAQQGVVAGPVVLLSPQGRRLDHALAVDLGRRPQLTLLCGRYEGVDERVRQHLVDEEVSIGDYVLTGGELPAMVLIEAVVRLLPGVLGDPRSAQADSFATGVLDHPHYTRPPEFRGWTVPDVLRSGNHAAIERWRRQQALTATARKRPDLIADAGLSDSERQQFGHGDADADPGLE